MHSMKREAEEPGDGKMSWRERVAAGAMMLYALAAILAMAMFFLCGCAAESAKIVEGNDLSVGFSLPGAEGEANFTVFNWLSGFKTTTAESSRVRLTYTCAETNDYFGTIHTRTWKRVNATITPVVDEAEDDEAEEEDRPNAVRPSGLDEDGEAE